MQLRGKTMPTMLHGWIHELPAACELLWKFKYIDVHEYGTRKMNVRPHSAGLFTC